MSSARSCALSRTIRPYSRAWPAAGTQPASSSIAAGAADLVELAVLRAASRRPSGGRSCGRSRRARASPRRPRRAARGRSARAAAAPRPAARAGGARRAAPRRAPTSRPPGCAAGRRCSGRRSCSGVQARGGAAQRCLGEQRAERDSESGGAGDGGRGPSTGSEHRSLPGASNRPFPHSARTCDRAPRERGGPPVGALGTSSRPASSGPTGAVMARGSGAARVRPAAGLVRGSGAALEQPAAGSVRGSGTVLEQPAAGSVRGSGTVLEQPAAGSVRGSRPGTEQPAAAAPPASDGQGTVCRGLGLRVSGARRVPGALTRLPQARRWRRKTRGRVPKLEQRHAPSTGAGCRRPRRGRRSRGVRGEGGSRPGASRRRPSS